MKKADGLNITKRKRAIAKSFHVIVSRTKIENGNWAYALQVQKLLVTGLAIFVNAIHVAGCASYTVLKASIGGIVPESGCGVLIYSMVCAKL
ncbi:MAG: hypothetical protein ABL861_09775 [Nitrosomonas sp.]